MDQGAEDSRDSLAKETDPTIPWAAGGGPAPVVCFQS